MPFKSKAQMKYMFAKMPKLAKKWAKKYGMGENLPTHIKKTKKVSKGAKAYVKRVSGRKVTEKKDKE